MVKESDFQTKFARELKNRGFVVLKYNQNATTRAGVPDLVALKDAFWMAFEIKRSKNAKFQPLQRATIEKLDKMCYARAVYPENMKEILKEVDEWL